MDSEALKSASPRQRTVRGAGLSYKFERLRERLRAAINSGELSAKLPGERALARKFQVNAKTLSKALTDLAAEGVLQRSIGRGTYVAGQAPREAAPAGWLLLVDENSSDNPVVTELLKRNPEAKCISISDPIRPSLLLQYSVVINCGQRTPESVYHDLAIRGIPIIETMRMPRTYSTHAVLLDRHMASFRLGRDMLLAGHIHLAAIDSPGSITTFDALKQASSLYQPRAVVETVTLEQIPEALSRGTSGFVCDDVDLANQALCVLNGSGARPGSCGEVTLAASGAMSNRVCCSGYYLDPAKHAETVASVAAQLQPNRLSVIWLNGAYMDRGTIGSRKAAPMVREPMRQPALLA